MIGEVLSVPRCSKMCRVCLCFVYPWRTPSMHKGPSGSWLPQTNLGSFKVFANAPGLKPNIPSSTRSKEACPSLSTSGKQPESNLLTYQKTQQKQRVTHKQRVSLHLSQFCTWQCPLPTKLKPRLLHSFRTICNFRSCWL